MNEERVALVTGGSKGIGFAIAQRLAKRKIERLVLVARNEQDLEAAMYKIEKEYPKTKVDIVPADLAKPEAYSVIYKHLKHYGKLDILVNNAGDFKQLPTIGRESPDHVTDDVVNLFKINAIPPAVFEHVLMPLMLASKHPLQLDVLSSAALQIFSGNNPYGPTKAAHERISLQTVADSCGRICTYRVYPSNVDTRLVAHFTGPKLTPEMVAEKAVDMMLDDTATDLYIKMGHKGLVTASFQLLYSKYLFEDRIGDMCLDGLKLVSDHRELIQRHFEPAIDEAKNRKH